MANKVLQDFFEKPVRVGEEVVVLIKDYGYRKISNAYLLNAIYIGYGRYGHRFVPEEDYEAYNEEEDEDEKERYIFNMKNPECVKVFKED